MSRNTDGGKTIAAYESLHRECWYAYTASLPPEDARARIPTGHRCAKDAHPDEAPEIGSFAVAPDDPERAEGED